jgi:hypothetical protein
VLSDCLLLRAVGNVAAASWQVSKTLPEKSQYLLAL